MLKPANTWPQRALGPWVRAPPKRWAHINTGMVLLLVTLYCLLGGSSFSVYIKEMALNIMSVKDAAVYLTILAVYGFTIEFVFRKMIQDRFLSSEKKWVKKISAE